MAAEQAPHADSQSQDSSDTAMNDAHMVVDRLLAYVRQRMEATDVTAEDLNGLDMDSDAFRIAMRHGMTIAFHELEHQLTDTVHSGIPAIGTVRPILPREVNDPSQAWYWTPEWQAKEREAEESIAAGRFTRFESDDDFLRSFDDLDADADV